MTFAWQGLRLPQPWQVTAQKASMKVVAAETPFAGRPARRTLRHRFRTRDHSALAFLVNDSARGFTPPVTLGLARQFRTSTGGPQLSSERLSSTLGGAHPALSHSETRLSGFQDRGRSPHGSLHGLYRTLILAHGEHAT